MAILNAQESEKRQYRNGDTITTNNGTQVVVGQRWGATNDQIIAANKQGIRLDNAGYITGLTDDDHNKFVATMEKNIKSGQPSTLEEARNAFKPISGGYAGSSMSYIGQFAPSEAYTKAMEYTNQLLSQLSSGRTSYTDKVNAMMDQIANREKFSYDPDTDPLFQQYLQNSMESGRKAMNDTIGQASALTGGYGSTYATAAANGAYNNYVQDAYNNLDDYYRTALEAYEAEGQDLYNKLGMYQTADESEYNRLSNAYNANFANAQNMYNQEYSNYWDTANYNMNVDQFNADQAYKAASMAQDAAKYNSEMEYKVAQDKASANAESSYKSPSETQLKNALNAYNSGGEKALNTYVDSLDSDIDVAKIAKYINDNGSLKSGAYDYTQVGNLGLVNNTTGSYTSVDDLYNQMILEGYSAAEANAFISKYYRK